MADKRVGELTAELEAEREQLNRERAKLKDRGFFESGCQIGDGRDLADWREEGPWPKESHPDSNEKRSDDYSLQVLERKQYSLSVGVSAGIKCRLACYVKFYKIDTDEGVQAGILASAGQCVRITLEKRDKRRVKATLGRYLPPTKVSQVKISRSFRGSASHPNIKKLPVMLSTLNMSLFPRRN